ncbi:MAG: alpha/beta hydrolase [Candidatus Kariarchaeaceae archaeon]|jgi:predicted alpha/beta superfamily hydrolase
MQFRNFNIKVAGLILISIIGISFITIYLLSDSDDDGWKKEETIIHSSILGDDFDISIGLPSDYEENSATGYHAIYLLDAMYHFDESHELSMATNGGVFEIVQRFTKEEKLPKSILIGIGYPPDLQHRERYVHNNARFFRDFFRTELIPYIESNYNVISDPTGRTLLGHSGGAHFAVFSIMADRRANETTFSQYVAVAGAYHSSNLSYKEEERLFNEIGIDGLKNISLYLTIGTEDEIILYIPSEPSLLQAHRDFVAKLQSRGYTDLTLECTEHEGYRHYDVVEVAYEDGLEWIFSN